MSSWTHYSDGNCMKHDYIKYDIATAVHNNIQRSTDLAIQKGNDTIIEQRSLELKLY